MHDMPRSVREDVRMEECSSFLNNIPIFRFSLVLSEFLCNTSTCFGDMRHIHTHTHTHTHTYVLCTRIPIGMQIPASSEKCPSRPPRSCLPQETLCCTVATWEGRCIVLRKDTLRCVCVCVCVCVRACVRACVHACMCQAFHSSRIVGCLGI